MRKECLNFEELIIAAQNGSDEAMTEILEMYMPWGKRKIAPESLPRICCKRQWRSLGWIPASM
mgnify:CR=1 FL=1